MRRYLGSHRFCDPDVTRMTERTFLFKQADLEAIESPSEGRVVYRDTKVPGLELRVTANGIKTFSLRRRVRGGDVERHTIGRFPEVSVIAAREKANEYIPKLAVGVSVAEQNRAKKGELRFRDLFDQYLERHAKPRKRTWKEDKAKYDQHLAKALGPLKLSAVTRQAVATVHSTITLAGTPIAANRVLALVSSIFGWARSAGLWEGNPASAIRKNGEQPRDRFLQSDELPRFFMALAAEPNEIVRDYILLSLLTGARRADVMSMAWRDVSLDRAEWRIKRTKNDDPITVTLSTEAVEILRARQPKDDEVDKKPHVFPGSGKSGHLSAPYKGWMRVLARTAALGFVRAVAVAAGKSQEQITDAETLALQNTHGALAKFATAAKKHRLALADFEFEDIRIHDLRRTLGSWQAKQGASLTIIGKSLNHRSVVTTAIYARLDQDPVRQSVQAASSAIHEAAGVKMTAKVVAIKKTA